MKNICEWTNCKEFGKFKAPTEKDNSKKFKLLCDKHIKLFNKSWNYFEGMSENEITNFLKSDGSILWAASLPYIFLEKVICFSIEYQGNPFIFNGNVYW